MALHREGMISWSPRRRFQTLVDSDSTTVYEGDGFLFPIFNIAKSHTNAAFSLNSFLARHCSGGTIV